MSLLGTTVRNWPGVSYSFPPQTAPPPRTACLGGGFPKVTLNGNHRFINPHDSHKLAIYLVHRKSIMTKLHVFRRWIHNLMFSETFTSAEWNVLPGAVFGKFLKWELKYGKINLGISLQIDITGFIIPLWNEHQSTNNWTSWPCWPSLCGIPG